MVATRTSFARDVTGRDEGETDDAGLGRGVRCLPDLPLVRCDGCGHDHDATFAVHGFVLHHAGGREAQHVEAADQIDSDDFTVEVGIAGLPVLLDHTQLPPRPPQCTIARTVYTAERKVFGKPVASFQNSKFVLAECAADVDAINLMADRALELRDAGDLTVSDAAKAKLFCTENADA